MAVFHPITQNTTTCGITAESELGATSMEHKRFWVLAICVGLLLMLAPSAIAQDTTSRDLNGISPQNHKYFITTLGGAAAGAGLGFLLGGGLKTAKLALIGGGGASAWFLHTHPYTLGRVHDWAMVGSGTALGMGIGWTICDCDHGLIAGTLLGGGGTAVWEALKNDRAARNAYNRTTNKTKKDNRKERQNAYNTGKQQ
jgi:hypothetical protein